MADVEAVATMDSQPPGAFNGDAVPFKNIHLALSGYNVFYADPAPLVKGQAVGTTFQRHVGKYLGGYAAGDSTKRDVPSSKARCEELKDKCGGFTCTSSDNHCTVRASTALKGSPSGEVSYLKKEGAAVEQVPKREAGTLAELLNTDPGLRKPVFALEYTRSGLTGDRRHTTPDGYHTTVDAGCSTAFTSKAIRDEYEYSQDTSNEISLTGGVEASVGVSFPPADDDDGGGGGDDKFEVGVSAGASLTAGASGTLSHKDQEIRNENELRDSRMERSIAKCSSYVAAIEYGNFPKTHPDFQKAVVSAGDSAEKHWDLFDDFGTHFLTAIKMGARHTVRSYFRNDQYDTMTSKIKGLGVSVGVTASASAGVAVSAGKGDAGGGREVGVDASIGASADLLSPKEKKAVDTMSAYIEKSEMSSMGPPLGPGGMSVWWDAVQKNPVPIRFDKREICLHPAFKGAAKERCQKSLKGYCEGRLKAKGAPCQDMSERECFNDMECKEDHLCRDYQCKAAPICQVTLCDGELHRCGGTYTLPKVMHANAANGRVFDLKNGDWWDRVSAFKLSDGCKKIEAVDDDGQCRFGKGDNGRYTGSVNLPYDLDDDVCMVRVFAKDLPSGRALSANDTVAEDVPGLARLNAMLASRRLRQPLLPGPPPAAPQWAGEEPERPRSAGQRHRRSLRSAQAKLRLAAERGAPALNASLRQLTGEVVDKASYVKNIGKAMYGYNHFFAAPLSAEYAGTDPGFQHRAVWEDHYTKGSVVSVTEFTEIPKGKPTQPHVPSLEQVAYNCNCGDRLVTHDSGKETVEKCSQACLGDASCKAFGLWTKQGKSAGACALYKDACPAGSGDGHSTPTNCPLPTAPEWFNVVYNRVAPEAASEIPTEKPAEPFEPVASNCNCGDRLVTHFSGKETEEKCSQACLGDERCKAFGLWTNEGKSAGACALYKTACPAGSGDGHSTTTKCPQPTSSEWFNVVYNRVARRRLQDGPVHGAPERAPLHAGPPRMLADGTLEVPDGWKVKMGKSTYCERSFTSKEIKSSHAYKKEMKDEFSLGGIDIGPASFDYSSESREFNDRSSKDKRAMIASSAECVDFLVEMEDLENNPPPTSSSFQFVVEATSTGPEFYALFDMFGLHFPDAVVFGARYGLTRYIDEQNYKSLLEESESTTVTVGVSHTVGVDKGAMSAGVTVSAEVSNTQTTSTKTRQAVAKYTEEVREFSVGKRMPDKGGAAAWVKDVEGEPMPIRFSLRSLCDHPAFAKAGTKEDCFKYSATYCKNHLAKLDEDLDCTPPPEPECQWDLDCKADHHTCEEGVCVKEPDCYVWTYSNTNLGGSEKRVGPIYRRERPTGQVEGLGWMGGAISSVKISKGCEEVVLMDEDKCREVYEDNEVIDLRTRKYEVRKNSLPYDLDNDVCKVKVLAKWNWN